MNVICQEEYERKKKVECVITHVKSLADENIKDESLNKCSSLWGWQQRVEYFSIFNLGEKV